MAWTMSITSDGGGLVVVDTETVVLALVVEIGAGDCDSYGEDGGRGGGGRSMRRLRAPAATEVNSRVSAAEVT